MWDSAAAAPPSPVASLCTTSGLSAAQAISAASISRIGSAMPSNRQAMAAQAGSSARAATQSATSTSAELPQVSTRVMETPRSTPWAMAKPRLPDWLTIPSAAAPGGRAAGARRRS